MMDCTPVGPNYAPQPADVTISTEAKSIQVILDPDYPDAITYRITEKDGNVRIETASPTPTK